MRIGFAGERAPGSSEFIGAEVSLDVTEVEQVGRRGIVSAMVGGRGLNGTSHSRLQGDGDRVTGMTIRA